MAKHTLWRDDYWLPLMQLYMANPIGPKETYAKRMVALALEWHIHPQFLHAQMLRLQHLDTPKLKRLWDTYDGKPKQLAHAVNMLRRMNGFGQAEEFYEGVEVCESWECDFRPVNGEQRVMPMHLVLILDLYFRLTPITMVADTPEVKELANKMGIDAGDICRVLLLFQECDPYLNRKPSAARPLKEACQQIWNRYGNDNPDKLSCMVEQLMAYFRK